MDRELETQARRGEATDTVGEIHGYDTMPPFLMSLVSESDLWMYVSSYGALTAGRVDVEHCLFPYVTDDRLHRYAGTVGPVTTFRVREPDGAVRVWHPFSQFPAPTGIQRLCDKSLLSDRITFEETHEELGLAFRYTWSTSERFGFVRTATLENHSDDAVTVDMVDGLIDILPAGIGLATQQQYSCLIDAYTRCEIDTETGIAVFALSAQIVDRPEPAESLTANTVWCRGIAEPTYLLSADQLPAWENGQAPRAEPLLTGRRGAFLVAATQEIPAGGASSWDIVADVNRSQGQVEALRAFLRAESDPQAGVRDSVESSSAALARLVASADGRQISGDAAAAAHHASCALFNIMRGGVFAYGYQIPAADFQDFVARRNQGAAQRHEAFLRALPETLPYDALLRAAQAQADNTDLLRLTYEYLPLTFSRRHGDPSRPWNAFSIRVKADDGSQILDYQGNWRDIFQNWEALCVSFPGFLESVIAKFVNASTVDGFNPYRVTRDGIDWEAPEPDNPWSSIGYWGDHQIIYLLKLLEASHAHHPGLLRALLDTPVFSYADVPYRIKPYPALLQNPKDTIVFDAERAANTVTREKTLGSDARLLAGRDGRPVHVTLAEKLLVPLLSKICSLVLDGGIWMNTQRPEWNDANNALVGNGVSLVTACYLRRYAAFCRDLFAELADEGVAVSAEVAAWAGQVAAILERHHALLDAPEVTDGQRRLLLDDLGAAFSEYRTDVYAKGFSGSTRLAGRDCKALCEAVLPYLDHTIRANRRADGLYHSYNLLDVTAENAARIDRLYEMLEGQVAVLSAGLLSAAEADTLVDALFASRLYRPDQQSFLLYPDRALPGFLQKNIIPPAEVERNPLLTALLEAGDKSVIERDAAGQYRFNSRFRNAADLRAALDRLAEQPAWEDRVRQSRDGTLAVYEDVFHHRAFTGRSGTMYGYEGLGCIYWHMVSKLLLGIQESGRRAAHEEPSGEATRALISQYYRVRAGMGFNKDARTYGAFPPDPYSHTPAHAGARQPGMTGQAKEDLLTRWGELGIAVSGGCLAFQPTLLRRREFLAEARPWSYFDGSGSRRVLDIPAGSLAFTLYGVPVVYRLCSGPSQITIHRADSPQETIPGLTLDAKTSGALFLRVGGITRLEVDIPDSLLAAD